MTGDPPALSRFELAARELRALGIVMTRLPGEYRVNYRTGITKPSAREARQTTAPHDAEGDPPPGDPGAQSPHARAGLAKKGVRPRHRTGFPKRHVTLPESTLAIANEIILHITKRQDRAHECVPLPFGGRSVTFFVLI